MKKTILLFSMLLPFFVFSQNIISITPAQAMQGQTLPLVISGNNMQFSGWSCWSQTGNLSDFKFMHTQTTATMNGISISSSTNQLNGNLIVPTFQPTGVYDLEVFDGSTCTWILFPFSFEITGLTSPSFDCDPSTGICSDPGNGLGTYTTLVACLSNCTVTPSWNCDGQGNCSDPGNGNGTYATLTACQSNCITPTWDCISPGNCQDPGTGNGTYASLTTCQTACPASTWDCTNGACIDPLDGSGTYSSANACQTACIITPTWHCDGQGNCFDPGTGGGLYLDSLDCVDACDNSVDPSWDCDGQGNCFDPTTGFGPYTALVDCQLACANTAINEEISNLLIYPNPAKNTLTIDGDYTSATIYNVFGKVVLTTDYQKTINVATLSNGIYFINLEIENQVTTKKLVITN